MATTLTKAHGTVEEVILSPSKDRSSSRRVSLEEWFNDTNIEVDTEIDSLRQFASKGTGDISAPNSTRNPHLARLVNEVNITPNTTYENQEHNIHLLGKYLDRSMRYSDVPTKLKRRHRFQRAFRRAASVFNCKTQGPLKTKVDEVQLDGEEEDELFKHLWKSSEDQEESAVKRHGHSALRVLISGVEMVKTITSLAADATGGTYVEVAVNVIMIFVTAWERAQELTQEIGDMFVRIDGYNAKLGSLQDKIKSRAIFKASSKLFTSIMTFIVSAASYLRHGTCRKLVIHFGGSHETVEGHMKAIIEAYDALKQEMDFAGLMMTTWLTKAIPRLNQDTAETMRALRRQNQDTANNLVRLENLVRAQSKFRAELHIQGLRAGLFGTPFEPSKEMAFNDRERIFLSPRDRWPRQFKLRAHINPAKSKTSTRTCQPLRWVSGHVSRRNVCWVSSLCVDLITYFREFSNFDVAYAFCKRGHGTRYTPILLIKALISQLLEAHPDIAMRNLHRLSLARFQEIGTDTKAETAVMAWKLLDDMLRLIEEAPELRDRMLLIVIDRLDLCVSEDGYSVLNDLIPNLQGLSRQHVRVVVMITTARLSAFAVPTLRKGPEWLQAYGKREHG